MDTLEFFERVLPETGTYCAFGAIGPEDNRSVRQLFAPTLADLINIINRLDEKGFDTYQALATFNQVPGETDPKKQWRRKQEFVHTLKSFYLDIDCKDPAKDYLNWREALLALGDFVTQVGLPKPLVVRSGGGLHAYWPLDTEISQAEWQPVAEALKAACLAHGLKIDRSVPADSARILRPPGTTHVKTGRKVTVIMDAAPVTLDEMRNALAASGHTVAPPAPAKPARHNLINTILTKPEFPAAASEVIEVKCQQLSWAVNNQGQVLEPFWYALLGVAAHCVDPEATAIRWSNQHPAFNQQQTLDKLDQWRRQTTGPATCKRLENENPNGCKGCKYKDKITTPVQIGAQFAEVAPAADVPDPGMQIAVPKPFKRTTAGMVITLDDTDLEICPFEIYPVSYGNDESLGHEIVRFRWKRPHVGWKDLVFRQAYLVEGAYKEFSGIIADQGIVLYNKKRTETFQLMLRSYMEELRKLQTVTNHHGSMGWKENFTQFLVGDVLYRRLEDGTVTEENTGVSQSAVRQAERTYALAGEYKKWRKMTHLLDNPAFPAHALGVAVSLSTVFYAFTGLKGLTLSFYGETGSGKTLAQKWMQSVWGNPEELHFSAKFTVNSLFHRLATHCHLPMTVDEATMMADKDVGDFIYWVSQGRDKARLTKTISERDPRGWATVVTLSTNKSIASKIISAGMESDAQMVRLLELSVPPTTVFTKDSHTGSAIYRVITENYGYAGREFVRKLMELGPSKIKELVHNAPSALCKDFNVEFTGQERYWEQLLALAYLAGTLAKKWGIVEYDVTSSINWALEQVKGVRANIKETRRDSFDLLAEFLNEHSAQAATVIHTPGQRPITDLSRLPRGEVLIRYDVHRKSTSDACTHGTVLVDNVRFKRWCSDRGYDYKAVMLEIKSTGSDATPRSRKAMLTKDTGINGAQVYVFGLKMNHDVFAGVFEGADASTDSLTYGQFAVIKGNKGAP
jgi:hypothetical protein